MYTLTDNPAALSTANHGDKFFLGYTKLYLFVNKHTGLVWLSTTAADCNKAWFDHCRLPQPAGDILAPDRTRFIRKRGGPFAAMSRYELIGLIAAGHFVLS